MDLALKLIDSMTDKFKPEDYIDEYQNKVKRAIDKKIDGKSLKKAKEKRRTTVTNLMDALEKSLKQA